MVNLIILKCSARTVLMFVFLSEYGAIIKYLCSSELTTAGSTSYDACMRILRKDMFRSIPASVRII